MRVSNEGVRNLIGGFRSLPMSAPGIYLLQACEQYNLLQGELPYFSK